MLFNRGVMESWMPPRSRSLMKKPVKDGRPINVADWSSNEMLMIMTKDPKSLLLRAANSDSLDIIERLRHLDLYFYPFAESTTS